MHPSSTSRWPWAGSRPVVSVSRTISRMLCAVESVTPFWHFSYSRKNFTYLRTCRIESFRCIHDEIRAFSFFRVRHLVCRNPCQLLCSHAGTLENTRALNVFRRGYDHHGVAAPITAGFEQQGNIQHCDWRIFPFGLGKEALLGGAHQWMHDSFEFLDRGGIVQHMFCKHFPIDFAAGGGARKCCFNERYCFAFIKAMHGCVGVMDRYAQFGEEPRRGRFAHSQRTGETEHKHWSAVDKFVLTEVRQQWH